MTEKEIIDLLLNRSNEVTGKFNNAVTEILRLGCNSERGKAIVPDLIDSIEFSIEDMLRVINRNN